MQSMNSCNELRNLNLFIFAVAVFGVRALVEREIKRSKANNARIEGRANNIVFFVTVKSLETRVERDGFVDCLIKPS